MPRLLRPAVGALLVSFSLSAFAQDGTARRIGLGTSLGVSGEGVPRYREDTGWDSSNFGNARWGVEYGTSLSASPWVAVHQADRTNAAFTAAANLLTIDLGGGTYVVRPFLASGQVRGGRVIVSDRLGGGAYLKVVNGTLDNNFGSSSRLIVAESGTAGRLFVGNALVRTNATHVGVATGAQGFLVLESGGRHTVAGDLLVGTLGVGSVELRGAGSELTAGAVRLGDNQGTGLIVLRDASALLHVTTSGGNTTGALVIENVVPAGGGDTGLRVLAGTARVDGDLKLATAVSGTTGVVSVEGGTVTVGGNVLFGVTATDTAGGKVFLRGGRFEVAGPAAFAPAAQRQFYWDAGTLAFAGQDVTLTDAQLRNYTAQGAAAYGGGRAAGSLAAGQVLDAAGKLTLSGGTIGLSGGTIRAGTGLVLVAPVAGHGTLDAVVLGTAGITNATPNALSVGALGGSNAVSSDGTLLVGGRNVDATFAGTASGAGAFVKVGTGTQTVTGSITSEGGVEVRQGALAFDGPGPRLGTSTLAVGDGAALRFTNGATGTVTAATVGGSAGAAIPGRLEIAGAGSGLSVSGDLTNRGWIDLAGGTLDVGGTLVNHGRLLNNGAVEAVVSGTGVVSGSGSFTGPVTIAGGATLAPGNSPGTTTFTDLTLGPGGAFELELAAATGTAGVDWDLAAVTGVLSVAATAANPYAIVLKSLDGSFAPGSLAGFDPTRPFSWKFVSAAIADPPSIDLAAFRLDASDFAARNDLAGGSFRVTAAGDGLYVGFAPQPAAVPEPGSLLLLTAAGLTAGAVRLARRRRS